MVLKPLKTSNLAFTLIILLFLSITTYQQIQITNLQKLTINHDEIKSYLMANYGVSSIDELIQKKLEEYGSRYTGNPFTTALYQGQLQAENITGMHWYTYLSGALYNRTDVIARPEQMASYIISTDGTIYYAKNGTTGQIDYESDDVIDVIQYALDNGEFVLIKSNVDAYLSDSIKLNTGNIMWMERGSVLRFDNIDVAIEAKNKVSGIINIALYHVVLSSTNTSGNKIGLDLTGIGYGRFFDLRITIYGPNSKAIYCDGSSVSSWENEFYAMVLGGDKSSGSVGYYSPASGQNKFFGGRISSFDKGIYLNNTNELLMIQTSIENCQSYLIHLDGTSSRNKFFMLDLELVGGGSGTVIRCEPNTDSNKFFEISASGYGTLLDNQGGDDNLIVSTSGVKTAFTFVMKDVPNGTVSTPMVIQDGLEMEEYRMPQDGSIVAITVLLRFSINTGNITVKPTINGVEKDLPATVTAGTYYAGNATSPYKITFVGGQRLGVKVTTSSDLTPTTRDMVVVIFVVFH